MANHKIGSSESTDVFLASAQMTEMLMLLRSACVSEGATVMSGYMNVRWPNCEADQCDYDHGFPGEGTTVCLSVVILGNYGATDLSSPAFML